MKVVAYCRVSTDEQHASGLGLESQIDKVKTYASLYDLELVDIITDAASGKNLNREGLDTTLNMLKKEDAEGVLVAKLDRLTRSVKDMGELLENYFSKQYSLFVVVEQIDTSTASGRMMINILMSVAQWERETIGERTKDALAAKRKRGEKTGGDIPFGYDLSADGHLTKNNTEQKAIHRIHKFRKKGYSLRAICQKLEKEECKTKTGSTKWHPQSISRILSRAA
jgi:site-specific DNA recombinase